MAVIFGEAIPTYGVLMYVCMSVTTSLVHLVAKSLELGHR